MNTTTAGSFYDTFYAEGGWRYSRLREWWWHWLHVKRRFHLPRGAQMLEIACGMGFHTDLFNRMGFKCAGLDCCATAIAKARAAYPQREFHLCDARGDLPFAERTFDVVITRGCSLYHYDLHAPATLGITPNLMRYLRPGGRFILVIVSDLSGRREPGAVWQNRMEDYRAHFARFDPHCTVDWTAGVVVASAGQCD